VISSAIGSKLVAPEHANQLVGIICPIAWKPLASVGVSHGIFGLQANSFSCSLVSRQLDTTGYNFSNAGKPWRKSQPLSRKMPKHAQTPSVGHTVLWVCLKMILPSGNSAADHRCLLLLPLS